MRHQNLPHKELRCCSLPVWGRGRRGWEEGALRADPASLNDLAG